MDNNITGRKDPRYANAPAISRVLENEIYDDNSDAARAAYRQITLGQSLTPDDKAHADIVRSALGKRFIGAEKDAYGADVVRYLDKDGQEATAYVNKPGLDMEDVNNFGLQSLPYLLGGRIMQGLTRNMSLPMKMMGQSGMASTTSVLGDVAAMGAGSEQGPDFGRATAVGLIGGAAEGLSPLAGMLGRRFITEPSLYNKSAGKLTPKGEEVAKKAGFDPADITGDMAQEFVKKYAEIRNPMVAGQTVRGKEFDIPVTRGQMEKDPGRLLNEKAMRYGAFGDAAKATMQGFDDRQAAAISEAALGGGQRSIANVINPTRPAAGVRPGDIGEGIRSGVRSASDAAKTDAKAAWKKVEDLGDLTATSQALEKLPQAIASELDGLSIVPTKETAPKATAMLDALRNYKTGGPPGQADEWLGNRTTPTVMQMQRTLGALIKGTDAADFDGTVARNIYRGFDKWIEKSADEALLKGDALTAAAFRTARDRTKELKNIFSARDMSGRSTPGGQLIEKIAKDDFLAPEAIVRGLFGTDAGSVPKAATIEALRRIKSGVDKYLPKDQAAPIWNDIRLAHWMNLVKTPAGNLHSPTMLVKRLDEAFNAQGSVMRELYKPDEIALIRRFSAALKDVSYKDPNPSGSAVSQLFFGGQWGQAALAMLGAYNGPLAKISQMLMKSTPVGNAAGYVAAQSAVAPKLRPRSPSLGAIGAGLTAQERESR
jgi:hypothetical protein